MKTTHRLLLLGLLALGTLSPAIAAADATADADYQAYEAQRQEPLPETTTPLEKYQASDARMQKVNALAFAFIEDHHADPRRWTIVEQLPMLRPYFITDWGPLNAQGQPVHPVVDEDARAVWQAKVDALQAAIEQATDAPVEVRDRILARRKALAQQQEKKDAFAARWFGATRETAPDFTVQDIEGNPLSLASLRGKTVILDFWATWCGPCKASMPHNESIAARYQDQDVVLVALCTSDTQEKFNTWLKGNRAKYPHFVWAFDPAGKSPESVSSKLFGVYAIPAQFVIDRGGVVVGTAVGFASEDDASLEALLAEAGVTVPEDRVALGRKQLAAARKR